MPRRRRRAEGRGGWRAQHRCAFLATAISPRTWGDRELRCEEWTAGSSGGGVGGGGEAMHTAGAPPQRWRHPLRAAECAEFARTPFLVVIVANQAPHVDKHLLRDGNVIGQLEALLATWARAHEDEETAVIETDKVAISVRGARSRASSPRCSRASATGWPSATRVRLCARSGGRRRAAVGRRARASWRRRGGSGRARRAGDGRLSGRRARAARRAPSSAGRRRRAPRPSGERAASARSLRSRAGWRWRHSRRRA